MRNQDYFVAIWALGHFAGISFIVEQAWIGILAYIFSIAASIYLFKDWQAWEPEEQLHEP